MVLSEHEVRDLRTVGSLMPEARTRVLKLDGDGNTVRSVCVGKRFICIGSDASVALFATDGVSPVMADPTPSTSNKKASTGITGASVQAPVATVSVAGDHISMCLACNERFLFVFSSKSVSLIDLASPTLSATEVMKCKPALEAGVVISSSATAGLVVFGLKGAKEIEAKSFLINSNGALEFTEVKLELPKFGNSGQWRMGTAGQMLAVSRGSDPIVLVNDVFAPKLSVCETKLSGGEVISLHCVPKGTLGSSAAFGPDASGLVVAQPDVVSVFTDKEGELELTFQFRDAINKVSFSTVDVIANFLVSVSSDAFSGRERLELFDLSFLKLKSAALQPLRRWDVSRLMTDVDEPLVAFTSSEFLSFVLTGSPGTAVVWEPVVRDQWYSVMANFEVLNRNEPYAEAEEEFDFNQNEDLSVVRTTINRYKRTERTQFNFIPDKACATPVTDCHDVDMSAPDLSTSAEVVFPFLQPLESWRSEQKPISRSGNVGSAHATFFSEGARHLLAKLAR